MTAPLFDGTAPAVSLNVPLDFGPFNSFAALANGDVLQLPAINQAVDLGLATVQALCDLLDGH